MNKSTKGFSRWQPREKSSWVFQVFQSYNEELDKNIWAYFPSQKYVYSQLKNNGAVWTDDVTKHFTFLDAKEELFDDLKKWSDSFNHFDNWVNQNIVMSISSNLETYLASIVLIALKSNPGTLLGSSKIIDGVSVLKNGSYNTLNYEKYLELVTKGDWNSRAGAFAKIFGYVPDIITRKMTELEAIRKLRNNIGHAFGRDIEGSRRHIVKQILPTEAIQRERALKYQRIMWSVAKSIDVYLLNEHIGEFQSLQLYHDIYPKLRKDVHPHQRGIFLKKEIGRSGVQAPSKLYCYELVDYYERL